MHEWSDFDNFENTSEYLPSFGDGDTKGTQAATALSKIVFRWFNDGDVYDNNYGLEGWANDISGSANWLYEYVSGADKILNRIQTIGSDKDKYTDILYDLATLVDPMIPDLNNEPKVGDAYDEEGPFEFNEHYDDEDYYDDEDDYDYEEDEDEYEEDSDDE